MVEFYFLIYKKMSFICKAKTVWVYSVVPTYKCMPVCCCNLHFFQPITSHSSGLLSCDWLKVATIQILRKHVLGDFLTHPHTLCVLLVSRNGQFLNPPSTVLKYVIYEWSLKCPRLKSRVCKLFNTYSSEPSSSS